MPTLAPTLKVSESGVVLSDDDLGLWVGRLDCSELVTVAEDKDEVVICLNPLVTGGRALERSDVLHLFAPRWHMHEARC